ncbi:endoribonuclease L-PSP [Erwinia typographi]|uniref:Endoribonuclease L-PSP n=1 Tax=Erwinia typographi TaxID=371042 RepID=A0A0A3Z540_9GAMM|nr:RidA family protein [Erwinia typographi]KGT92884.1 endoribonuclease L-PSP [Erwinia typographi]
MNTIPLPQGNYRPAKRHADIIYTAGMTPRREGVLIQHGPVANDVPLSEYREAVMLACANAIAAAHSLLMPDEIVADVLSMTVFIASRSDFTAHAQLADYASDYLLERYGSAGIGARAAVGVISLPGSSPVEIQLVVAAGKASP